MKKLLFVLTIALILASCGGDSKSNEGGGEMNTAAFFERYLDALCTASSKCASGFVNSDNLSFCPKTILNSPKPFEGFHKGESVIFRHKYEMLKNAEELGWMKLDMQQAESCFSVVSQMEPCNPLDVQLLDIPECANVFKGTKQLRDNCSQDEECKNGWCNMRGDVCPGACVDYKQPDQSCNSSLDKCVIGYECRSYGCSKSSTGVVNDPCVSNSDCTTFLFCYVKEGDSFGVCLKRKGEGLACTDANECVVGLSCVDNLCTRSRISDTIGSPCGVQPEKDENGNDIVLECNRFSKLECGPANVCQKMPAASNLQCSEFCDTDLGLYCDSSSHSCQWPKSAGTVCTKNEECASLYCAVVSGSEDGDVQVCQEPQCMPANED
ncbi:hypothetical protein J6Y50_01165 [bacterium]|nr:hypothetical protein [bacterium]